MQFPSGFRFLRSLVIVALVLITLLTHRIQAATFNVGAIGSTSSTGYYLESDGSFNKTGQIMVGTFNLTQTALLSLIAGWGDNTPTYEHYTNLMSYFTRIGTGVTGYGSSVAGWTFNTNAGAVAGTSSAIDTSIIPVGSQFYVLAFNMTNFSSSNFTTNSEWGLFTSSSNNWFVPAAGNMSLVVSNINSSGALIGTDLSLTATNAVQSNSVKTTLGSKVYLAWNNASGNADWSTNTASTNWSLSANNIYFSNSNNVRFDNAIMGSGTISVTNAGVVAGLISVTNTNGSTITLSGGAIAAASFNKSGDGALVVSSTLSMSNGFANYGGGAVTLSGNVTSGSMTQAGVGTLYLFGSNAYTGTTLVTNGSAISLGNIGSMTGTTNIQVSIGSTFLLGASNQVNPNAAVTLGGGKLSLAAAAPGNRASTQTFASLTLTANSVIDFGALPGASTLTFGSISGLAGDRTLSIWNWNGTTLWGTTSEAGGAAQYTRLYDLQNKLSPTELASISFYGGSGTDFLGTGSFVGTEIVPVPEPTAFLTATLLLGYAIFFQYSRRHGKVHEPSVIAQSKSGRMIS